MTRLTDDQIVKKNVKVPKVKLVCQTPRRLLVPVLMPSTVNPLLVEEGQIEYFELSIEYY